jgi:salicylate hydroxylase
MIPIDDFKRVCGNTNTKTTFFGSGKHMVVFPVRGGELINFVGYVWDEERERVKGHAGPWNEYLPVEDALADYEGWSSKGHALLKVPLLTSFSFPSNLHSC